MRWQFWARDKSPSAESQKVIEPALTIQPTLATIRCPLCGKNFHALEAKNCTSCALANKCGLVMCPNCSYEFAL